MVTRANKHQSNDKCSEREIIIALMQRMLLPVTVPVGDVMRRLHDVVWVAYSAGLLCCLVEE